MWEVLESVRRVAEKSRQVKVDGNALRRFSERLAPQGIAVPPWSGPYHWEGGGSVGVFYLLVLDTLNFCFWPERGSPRWEIEYGSQRLSGYYALAASLKRALESGVPLANAGYLATMSLHDLKDIIRGVGELQLLDRRLENVNELGRVLCEEYDADAASLVEAAEYSAIKLVRILAEKLLSFRDVSRYEDEPVFFYKRAQLFAADLSGAFRGMGWGFFRDMEELTAFADYKLPQVLRQAKILQYGKALAEKVDHRVLLEAGSPEEVEIRANTVWAVEGIREVLAERGVSLKSFEVDWVLWNLGQQPEFTLKPYHRTVTIFY